MLCLTYVFAALLEFACANYLSRQSEGILYGRKLKLKHIDRLIRRMISCHSHSSKTSIKQSSVERVENENGRGPRAQTQTRMMIMMNPYPDSEKQGYQTNGINQVVRKLHAPKRHRTVPARPVKEILEDTLKEDVQASNYYRTMAKSLDRTSRLLFPLSFGILSLIYWSYLFYTDNFEKILELTGGTDTYQAYGVESEKEL
ncbi:Oidioi.mRNA.OKI2018_I69.chr1.g973.t1.cds [Oikopleura dioica]|uniref:Oidioi.mRNA.OKI2018_I69.chr1.g973.t1.cds n=1 Tax=Oikopleura dioica TaxID=34765 RepID=A0ABN7SQ53_OIKDI|nr:Oidioi.mRNA.OKI2018_I69.chr1.g973.t1.cds [Oikopleura dioica]